MVVLDADVVSGMWAHLRHAGRHLLADLPYTVSTMRNNHLLGDALGLVAIGTALGRDRWVTRSGIGSSHPSSVATCAPTARWWRTRCRITASCSRCSRCGSSSVERPREVRECNGRCGPVPCRLGVLDGPVPQYGDWDEGRVLTSTSDAHDLAGSVVAALGLAGSGATAEQRSRYDEAAWYTREGTPVEAEPAETNGRDIGAGIGRIASSDTVAWLKMGSGPSHGHADLSSVSVVQERSHRAGRSRHGHLQRCNSRSATTSVDLRATTCFASMVLSSSRPIEHSVG